MFLGKLSVRKYISNDSQTSNMTPKSRKISLIILFVWMCTPGYVDAQSFTWDSTNVQMKTSMTRSILIDGQDSIVLTSTVNVAEPNFTMSTALFEVKQIGSSYITFCSIDLLNCVGYDLSICYCTFTKVKNVVKVVLNTTAYVHLSEASVQGTIYYFENKIKTSELTLPYIHDVSNPGIHLYINDKIDKVNLCNRTINQTTAVIVVEKANNKLQYLFSLQDNKTSVYLRNATNFLFHSVEIKEETVFRIAYEIPGISQIKSFVCTVKTLNLQTAECVHSTLIILSVVIACLLLFSIIMVVLKKLRKKNLYRKETKCCYEVIKEEHNLMITTGSATQETNLEELEEVHDRGQVKVDREMVKDRLSCVTPVLDSPVGVTLPSEILTIIKDMKNIEDKKEAGNLNPEPTTYDSINELIDSQLGLMVILSINKVSDKRPETWPGSVIPYPSHHSSNNNVNSGLRTGIGRIVSVNLKEHDGKMKHHLSTNDISYLVEIDVYTSRHVVFDDEEAKQTDVTLMIEGSEIHGAVLKGKCVRMASILQNWTQLTCVSNEIEIYKSLRQRVDRFNKEWSNINKKYYLFNIINEYGYIISIGERAIDSMVKANFTQLLDIYKKDRSQKKTSYTLNTQFTNENVAIYVERTSESLICGLPEEIKLTLPPDFGNEKWIFGSIPLVIKNLSIQDKQE
ncbi:hypothetical protein BgiBS90_019202 [Biomphalaria glabrata]|nr:hypothetical protein BgiBS90_019202 [Biomphalaria glabrata]